VPGGEDPVGELEAGLTELLLGGEAFAVEPEIAL
jgi:hypothetical protein